MPKAKSQKEEILKNLKDKLSKMKAAVFVNFSGISVKDINKLRDACRREGIDYLVVKKTLLKKALAECGYSVESDGKLSGEVASIFSYQDEVGPAKLAASFAKEFEKLKLISGILEGAIIDDKKIVVLSKLPSRDELLAKVIGTLNSPLSGLVGVLSGNLRHLVYVLNSIKEKKSA